MASKSWGVEFEGLEELMAQLERAGGSAMETVAREALRETHSLVTSEIKKRISPGNLPAGGRYSGRSPGPSVQDALINTANVEGWGSTLFIRTGFEVGKLPRRHIVFLIQGTPKMPAVKGLKGVVRGSGVKKKVQVRQREVFERAVKELLR